MRFCFHFLLVVAATNLSAEEVQPIHKLNRSELAQRLDSDVRAVQIHRDGLRSVIDFAASQTNLFPNSRRIETGLLRREDKQILWTTWQSFLDYMVALESMERYHGDFRRLSRDAEEDSFLIGHAAMLTRYRAALEFIALAENNSELDTVLNDPVPELGLEGGIYSKMKLTHLNLAIASEFAAREVLLETYRRGRQPELRKCIESDSDYIWKAGRGKGPELTARNAVKVIQNGAESAWLPVQAGVAEWMGDTRVYRPGRSLISREQIKALQPRLRPGDILLERREWYLSNIGLPGFWPHAALYIGTPDERREMAANPDVRQWVRQQGEASGNFEFLLQNTFPDIYQQTLRLQEDNHRVRIIEAISEGVSLTTLEHSADCDSLAVLRPRLSPVEKAQAVLRAFHFVGRPYDYDFDFATDSELVCTELVYKSYEPSSGFTGLNLPLIEMLGRKVTPANEIAKQFAEQQGTTDQQFDLVLFLDGQEKNRNAIEGSLGQFCASWQRPKWHVLVQGEEQ